MRHVILGGNGFLGRHLAQVLLDDGEKVVVCDVERSPLPLYDRAEFRFADVSLPDSLNAVPLGPGDVVYHLASRQYKRRAPRLGRSRFFDEVNLTGTVNALAWLEEQGCDRLVLFSTDMVYGFPASLPVGVDHVREPLGPYGTSKRKSEDLCMAARSRGMRVTIFRPRLIIGPGASGVLDALFWLVRKGFPVPMIGDGSNRYQMVSVFDCAEAARLAAKRDVPSAEFNLGSKDPPKVRDLLGALIDHAGSRSRTVALPGGASKGALAAMDRMGLAMLYPEQYLLADRDFVVDTSGTERELGWSPRYRDEEMLCAAYADYRSRA